MAYQLANGAWARRLPNGQVRFVKAPQGQPKVSAQLRAHLDGIRQTGVRGPNKRPSGRAPSNAYLLAKLKADKGHNRRAVRSDMSKKNKKVLDPNYPPHARIIRKAGSLNTWDVAGFDHGNKAAAKKTMRMRKAKPSTYRVYARAPRSAAQTAASKRNIRRARGQVGAGQQRAGRQQGAAQQYAGWW